MQNRAMLILEPDDSLLALVQDYLAQQSESISVIAPPINSSRLGHCGLRAKHLSRVKAYIQAHLGEPIALQDLAALTGLSPGHFARLFKISLGLPPLRYVIHQRVEKAKSLLKLSELPITEIAFEVGYDEVSNFIKAFRQETGVTPNKYRGKC